MQVKSEAGKPVRKRAIRVPLRTERGQSVTELAYMHRCTVRHRLGTFSSAHFYLCVRACGRGIYRGFPRCWEHIFLQGVGLSICGNMRTHSELRLAAAMHPHPRYVTWCGTTEMEKVTIVGSLDVPV